MKMIEKPSGWYYLRETGPYPTEDAAKEALKKHQETLRQNNIIGIRDLVKQVVEGMIEAGERPPEILADRNV